VLVYAQTDERQRIRATEIISQGGIISVQVLNEFVSVLRGKLKRDWPEVEDARQDILAALPNPVSLTPVIHERAVVLSRDHNIPIYDALIVAAALEGGCDTLYSEDLQHGRRFAGLAIVNPFL
jgi:predicted nucleic acid-binding protein